ncbi:LAME_0F09890g1_1 [Lachancea meyersii CBS 8951]|uniref:LAME_0F09890g1_1 n=1 Tax=Lachancea meyersii CBS 8951 TaxID=1266667 RepID=A0A1G4JV62_9SACH|nr:LAME_0F09890g1_1 [Lachancea meyersii CBS 8951]
MSSYFSNFSLNKFTDTISNAAHKTQDTLSNAISNIQLDDPQAILSLKARKHHLQESLGTIEDISKLPPQYQLLEKKCDALEKTCRRMLLVTKTFEVEGYDYPPNLSESISDFWSSNKDGLFAFVNSGSKKGSKSETVDKVSDADAATPASFSQAISKAAKDSRKVLKGLRDEEIKDSVVEDDEGEEEEEDLSALIKMFELWSQCEHKLDQGKAEMDALMAKEFNYKLSNLVDDKFKNAQTLRKKVEGSRLKFDTMRYEVKLKEQKTVNGAEKDSENSADKFSAAARAGELDSVTQTEATATSDAEEPQKPETAKTEEPTAGFESEEQELLEKLEDEFVSNTTEAVEVMGEITDSAELINLVKLFHNFKLIYHKQCVKDLENSLHELNELETEDD